MQEIRDYIRKNRTEEVTNEINDLVGELKSQDLYVEFGNIGQKTTYAMIYNEDHSTEYVGYTFIRNLKYYNESVGKLKALQQAIARRETLVADKSLDD